MYKYCSSLEFNKKDKIKYKNFMKKSIYYNYVLVLRK